VQGPRPAGSRAVARRGWAMWSRAAAREGAPRAGRRRARGGSSRGDRRWASSSGKWRPCPLRRRCSGGSSVGDRGDPRAALTSLHRRTFPLHLDPAAVMEGPRPPARWEASDDLVDAHRRPRPRAPHGGLPPSPSLFVGAPKFIRRRRWRPSIRQSALR
jgi:hypothetical protein